MAEQARVTSLDTLESFRSSLIIFITRSRNHVDLVLNEIHRTRTWVQVEQRMYWEGEIRKRRRKLDQAEQDLLSARLSSLRDNISAQMNAVRRAKAAVEEGERKLRNVRTWSKNYDSAIDPLAKKLESLRDTLDYRMPKGVVRLSRMQKTLEDYAEAGLPGFDGGSRKTAAPELPVEDSQP